MKHWLIAYDHRDGRLLMCDEYDDGHESGQQAIRDRFEWERYFDDLDVEVVVLGADSLDTVKRTHRRYFAGSSAQNIPALWRMTLPPGLAHFLIAAGARRAR